MVFGERRFAAQIATGAKAACLPQHDEDWCLAVKVGTATAHLGDESTKEAKHFESLDTAVTLARDWGASEVLIITGTKAWKF